MLEHIERGGEIPQRRHDEGDLLRDPGELVEEGIGVLDMLDGVRAESVGELLRAERQPVDIAGDHEIRDFGVLHDVDVHAAAVGLAAADVEIPDFAAGADDAAHDPVADPVQSR